MKSLKTAIFTVFTCLAVASCDFLEKEPYELTPETYFNNAAEASSFLTSVYAPLASQNFYGNRYIHLAAGDDLAHYGGGRNPEPSGVISCNNATASSPYFSQLWITLYSGIDRANTFLENIDKIADSQISPELRAQYRSEARFLRAYYYFILVEGWGDVPFKTTSTQSVTGLSIPRTDKETIYDFIVKEMDECTDGLLSASQLNYKPGRISKSTAWGILARVYLFRAGEHYRDHEAGDQTKIQEYFKQASTFAQKVMNEGHGLAENYWDVFIDLCSNQYNTTANESIWEIEFAGNYSTETRAEGRIGNLIGINAPRIDDQSITGAKDPGYAYAYYRSTPKLYELYVANGDIERMNWNIAPFEYVQKTNGKGVTGRKFFTGKMEEVRGQYWDKSYSYGENTGTNVGDFEMAANDKANNNYSRPGAKYRREYESQNVKKNPNYTSINFPVLRYSDVLLMIAEAENEINPAPTTLAYQCLNAVRNRAGISTFEEGSLDKDAFRQAVKDERGMELCFEYTRRFDLIRWGEYVSSLNALASRAQQGAAGNWTGGDTYSVWTFFQITDTYNYYPIPDTEMSVNTAITENNPGW
ncbi:RagB/SusD family nutrient uptake outer membrane protein [uncultured Bacteroides sp.]|uniref:RagB/SusD family nutrient uptake outer membrane protein n=1 Tax=uncultured Bacteroides sp. TaxID=162156 RepID=UPI00261C2727|nr:RagB/SusD family nutrient uptake outer membrane protein [uncultured Bacteroides sp.]